jgi:dTMP kinase
MSLYICLEALDGAGKSTALRLAEASLAAAGVTTSSYHDPDQRSALGRFVHSAWKERQSYRDEILHLLFAASSSGAQRDAMREAEGKQVLFSDRSPLSTYAYLPELSLDHFLDVHEAFVWPRIVLFLDIAPELAAERLASRSGDPFAGVRLLKESAWIRHRYDQILDFLVGHGTAVVMITITRQMLPQDVADIIAGATVRALADEVVAESELA